MLRLTRIHLFVSSIGLASLLSFGCGDADGNGDTGGDGGGSSSSSSGEGAGGGGPAKKRVFLTQSTFNGDLVSAAGSASDGLAAGDALCNASALKAGLGGSWKVWLSTDTVNAIDRLEDVGPWYDTPGEKVMFQSKAAIPLYPGNPGIVITENNSTIVSDVHLVWTGTNSGGHSIQGENCNGWTSTDDSAYGRTGKSLSTSMTWTDLGEIGKWGCSDSGNSLYCFEQ